MHDKFASPEDVHHILDFEHGWSLVADQKGQPYLCSPNGETVQIRRGDEPPTPECLQMVREWLNDRANQNGLLRGAAALAKYRWTSILNSVEYLIEYRCGHARWTTFLNQAWGRREVREQAGQLCPDCKQAQSSGPTE